MFTHDTSRFVRLALAAVLVVLVLRHAGPAQVTPEQAAAMLLASAKRAYNEKNFAFAADRFREFIGKYGSHKDLPTARYGLALCLIDGPQRDFDKAAEQLQALEANKTFAEYPFALYYFGLSRRGQGVKAVELAAARPAEATNHRNTARQRFDEASRLFGGAALAFTERGKKAKVPAKGLPIDLEWSARSRCDQAEMLLRLHKAKEAREATAFFADKKWRDSRYHALGMYYHGFACFLLGDRLAAGRSLSRTAVLTDEVFGTHARYLLGRVHHLNKKHNEREEARTQYQAVLKGHEQAKKDAQEKLRQPLDVDTKTRLEQLVRGPAPDHVARSTFFLAVLQYEDGRFGEALEHFKAFARDHPKASLLAEAQLRQGFCEVQLKQNDAALKTLGPLADKDPRLGDQALYWMAKALAGKADPAKPDSYKTALETFRKAAQKAKQLATGNPPNARAKLRRGEILADLAQTQQLARQYKDAAATYNTILDDKVLPAREDETLLNLATAQQLGGEYNESDKTCARFREKHAQSTLTPAVLFRHAENSSFLALAALKLPNPADRAREATKHNDEAIKRYAALIERYPEFAHVQSARHGLALAYYRKNDLEKAQKTLEAIPAADRAGELTVVSYQLADVLLRLAPARADDAVAAGKLEEKLKGAADLLDAYVAAAGDAPQVPDALLKLAYCHQRLGKLLVKAADQQAAFTAARAACEKLLQKYPKHDAAPLATFERARTIALAKDVNTAVNELKRFATDPLKKSSVAPLALLHLSTLLRGLNRPAEAATVLADCRKGHEDALGKDPARSSWVTLLRYHHAVALREANKLDDARALFDQVSKATPDRPEAWDSALRAGQCRKELAEKKIAEGRKQLSGPSLEPRQRQAAQKLLADGTAELRTAATYLNAQDQQLKDRKPATDELGKTLSQVRSRILYEAAWALRTVAELEVEAARKKIQLDRWEKRRAEVAKLMAPGQAAPQVGLPEVSLKDVPLQPAETLVRNQYRTLITSFPDLAINADARFELAELLADRDAHDEAVELLQGALEAEKEPSPELADKIKVRLGACLLDRGARKLLEGAAKLATPGLKPEDKTAAGKLLEAGRKDAGSALEQLQAVTANPKSALLAHATYREAECHLQLGKAEEAIKLLAKFRDHAPFQNLPGLSDRALLRLGFALAEKKQWEPSRQAYETLLGRFGASPWAPEARYGVGWAYQNLGQYDNAVNAYTQVTNAVATRLGARAQLNIGVCRHVQKRYNEAATALLVVPFTYDYPELSALALMEAARAFADNKQPAQAVKLLRRVVKDHPGTAHAEAAKKRLTEMGEG
jgi:TolA-binding protein